MIRDWMARTTSNQLLGPMTIDEVRVLVRSGKLESDDELCCSTDYWFFLYEADEVRSRLGIEPPESPKGKALEATQAITKTISSGEVPELALRSETLGKSERKDPSFDAAYASSSRRSSPPERRKGFEGVVLWKWATFILAFGLILVTARIFKIAGKGSSTEVPPESAPTSSDPQKTGP